MAIGASGKMLHTSTPEQATSTGSGNTTVLHRTWSTIIFLSLALSLRRNRLLCTGSLYERRYPTDLLQFN
jgi:hypothetical protein